MRRYFSDRHYASPSKENLRRRLFETPNRPGSGLAKNVKSKSVAILMCCAVTFLLGVHLYLLKNAILATNGNHTTVNSPRPQSTTDSIPISKGGGGLRKSYNNKARWPPLEWKLQPLRQIDVEQYTIRMNTWRRPEQLLLSVDHHASCEGVAQIQIVWCDKETEPPEELYDYSKVVIERHEENTLNERFRILSPTPTAGILSIDDDALRPCEALDAGFFKWTRFPDRMVGFDARVHVEVPDGSWKYGYMSTMERENKYSLSLTRYCFIHRDYMSLYINELPPFILNTVAQNLNCEDIAMSFMISSLTNGKPSLLADFWAIKSMIKMYSEEKISGGKSHKSLRDECVDNFAKILGLKENPSNRLRFAQYLPTPPVFFECGDNPGTGLTHRKSDREHELESLTNRWRDQSKDMTLKELKGLMGKAGFRAYQHGLVQNTERWKERFQTETEGAGD